jgi:hypothetical protein
MNFEPVPQLDAADTVPMRLLTGIDVEAEIINTAVACSNDSGSPCGGSCVEQIGGKTNE